MSHSVSTFDFTGLHPLRYSLIALLEASLTNHENSGEEVHFTKEMHMQTKTPFFIVTAVKTSNLTKTPIICMNTQHVCCDTLYRQEVGTNFAV
jgi:hypothetical protein